MPESEVVNRPPIERSAITLDEVLSRIEDAPQDPRKIVNALKHDRDTAAAGLDAKLTQLRVERVSRSASFEPDPIKESLNESIVLLAQENEPELVEALLSSAPTDMESVDRTIERVIPDTEEQAGVKSRIHTIRSQKQQLLVNTLSTNGASTDTIRDIFTFARDPDSALGIPQDFWEKFATFPRDAHLVFPNVLNLQANAELFSAINDHGLIEYAPYGVAGTASDFDAPDKVETYLQSLQRAQEIIPPDKRFGNGPITKNVFMHSLARLPACTEEQVQALITLQNYMNRHSKNTSAFTIVVDHIRDHDDPTIAVERIVSGLHAAEKLLGNSLLKEEDITSSTDPVAFAETALSLAPLVQKKSGRIKQLLGRGSLNPEHNHLNLYTLAELELKKYGMSVKDMTEEERTALIGGLSRTDPSERDDYIRSLHVRMVTRKEYHAQLKDKIDPAIASGDLKDIKPEHVTLDKLPELQKHFQVFGIEPDLAEKIFASWSTYNAIEHKHYELNLRDKVLNSDQVKKILKFAEAAQPDMITRQVMSMTTFAETYGNDELQAVIKTFGIYNFARYTPEFLHDQLNRWKNHATLPVNIAVVGRSDWNNAFFEYDSKLSAALGNEGLFILRQIAHLTLAKLQLLLDSGKETLAGIRSRKVP